MFYLLQQIVDGCSYFRRALALRRKIADRSLVGVLCDYLKATRRISATKLRCQVAVLTRSGSFSELNSNYIPASKFITGKEADVSVTDIQFAPSAVGFGGHLELPRASRTVN
jgi:hypothetical protein